MCGTFDVSVWARPHCRHRRAVLERHFGFDVDTTITRVECCAKQRARQYEINGRGRMSARRSRPRYPVAIYKASHAYTDTGPRNPFSERAVQTPLPRGRFAGYYGKPKCPATHRRQLYRLYAILGEFGCLEFEAEKLRVRGGPRLY